MNGYEILAGYSIGILVIYCVLLNAHYHSWYKTISERHRRLLITTIILWPLVAIVSIISTIMMLVFYPVLEPYVEQVSEDEYLSDEDMMDWYEDNKFPTQEKIL